MEGRPGYNGRRMCWKEVASGCWRESRGESVGRVCWKKGVNVAVAVDVGRKARLSRWKRKKGRSSLGSGGSGCW